MQPRFLFSSAGRKDNPCVYAVQLDLNSKKQRKKLKKTALWNRISSSLYIFGFGD
jgi:hypothetical protein